MFVDEKKVGEQQTDTRSDLERFIAWAKTRDPSETYEYADAHSCLLYRWDKSEGRNRILSGTDVHHLFNGCGSDIAQYGGVPLNGYRTVGGALKVALRIQGEK